MKISEIMTTDIKKATSDNTLTDVAAMMRDEDIEALPVVQDGELRGIVTDRDIVVRAIAEGKEGARRCLARRKRTLDGLTARRQYRRKEWRR